jgi:glycosyltransferase involved in cell wall biosynthesis
MRILFLTSDLDVTNGWGRYSAGFLAEARERNGVSDVIVPDPAGLKAQPSGWHRRMLYPLTAAVAAWKHRKAAKNADVIHAATEPVLPHAFFLSLMTGVPFIVSAHGTYGDIDTYHPALRWFYRLAFQRAGRIVAVSGYTAEIVRRGIPQAKIAVIPGGFSLEGVAMERAAPGPEPRILSIGAVKPRKGYHTLIEALGLLMAQGIRFRAECIGPKTPSAYAARLEARLKELGLEDRVRFTGRVSETELRAAYARADVFVLPSEHEGTAFEGLGLVYLEALGRGVPAIGCLESGATDVIQDGVNGLLVPPGDAEKLAAAISRVLNDEALRMKMSEAAPKSVERFRWETVGAEMDAAYQETIKEYAR